ncbi:MAG TPA: hypothetical protein VLC28_04280, partial [Flavitalea sp.]|nr:hypothetical protein [Flavitalea sp.]
MTQKQADPKGLKDTDRFKKTADEKNDSRAVDSSELAEDQVLNEEDQQTPVNPTNIEGDARG